MHSTDESKSNNMAWNIHLILYFIIKNTDCSWCKDTWKPQQRIRIHARTISVQLQLSSVINF